MLDSETKKRIDNLRNILVGKLPSPEGQVEQITTGLVYKFMHDMDEEAVEMGGVASFFVGDFEKYSWKHLFNPQLGGNERVKLYSEAIENMYTNPSAPQLFRDIFKNSFLPFKDPSTLNMFLKEIDEFHYSHSEKLGDAFEYLLSFMGSQGDAGQFRTPRHIIDFIVEIVNPQKDETILDPACGTCGFLISSYKHILTQNTGKRLGDKLTASERKAVGDNLVGYDISPDMTRISLVNMYLHQFTSPQIHEYDTLSSEDRWNEYYDVVLANPPFFSPTGGIQPHSRFGVKSTRAEVLFVDYIISHLKPNGRAAIIVPEGIIFRDDNAYKAIRKKLVENGLIGVISLHPFVFKPYSGVKTSILVVDKVKCLESDSIFFVTVENDGYSKSDQRKKIDNNDLPDIVNALVSGQNEDTLKFIGKDVILNHYSITLSFNNYQNESDVRFKKRGDVKRLEDVALITMGQSPDGKFYNKKGNGLEFHQGKTKFSDVFIEHSGVWSSEYNREANANSILMSVRAPVGPVNVTDRKIAIGRGLCAIYPKEDIKQKFLFYILRSSQDFLMNYGTGTTVKSINKNQIQNFEIPVPPLEIQQEIVDELEGYQKIIDGCRQVVENYKPTIDIDPSWEMVELGEICQLLNGRAFKKSELLEEGKYPVLRVGNFFTNNKWYYSDIELSQDKYCDEGDLLFAWSASFGSKIWDGGKVIYHYHIWKIEAKEDRVSKFFLKFLLDQLTQDLKAKQGRGGVMIHLTKSGMEKTMIPLPNRQTQDYWTKKLLYEKDIIEGNKKLIDIYTKKIQDRMAKVWGEA